MRPREIILQICGRGDVEGEARMFEVRSVYDATVTASRQLGPGKRIGLLAPRRSDWSKDLEDRDAKVWEPVAFAAYNASTSFDIFFCAG